MKSNTFNYSLLAVGVAAVLGISTAAMAETKSAGDTVIINNVANASYSVDGVSQTPVVSNSVTINVTESGSFSLIAQNGTGPIGDDVNAEIEVVPTGVAQFIHRLDNLGNLTDTYTMGLANNSTGDTKNFDLDATKASYVVYKKGTTTNPVTTVSNITGTALTGTAIVLAKDEYAIVTIDAKTVGNIGGDTQNLTLTAKSTYLAGKGSIAAATATNIDESITKLPVFSIVKTVSQTLDINKPNATAEYTIVVKNDNTGTASYAADAINIKIVDNLPIGLKLVTSSLTQASITTTGAATKGTISQNTKGAGAGTAVDGFEISGVDIPVGESVTIKFQVQKDELETLDKTTINHARVEASLGGGSNVTVIDGTDSGTNGGQNTATYYPSTGDSQNSTGAPAPANTVGGDSTQPLTSNQRGLTLTGVTVKEIPNTSGANSQAVHQTVITNTGREVEGAVAGNLKFKIEDGATNANVKPADTGNITLVYDVDGDLATVNDRTSVNVPYNASGEYDVNSAFPAGIASKGTVTISYNVVSTNAVTDSSETTKVTLIPTGTDAPTAPASVVDTTNVKGLKLVKSQALDKTCSGAAADSAFSDSATALIALPGECVIYRIVATNDFTSLDIKDLLISDKTSNFSSAATVFEKTTGTVGSIAVANAGSTISAAGVKKDNTNANTNGEAVYATVTTLKAADKATLKFVVKIKP